ncbi:MAG: DUF262 domain-containing protein [Carnobacterium sp.]|uniref:DUF262 domain-containing protein n=1 Tax=Carnobacterium sp. TaxID=48221 RepID=UPI003315E699
MDFKPYDTTIKSLLISQKQFVIPRFQREYSWDKKNYQEFLDDMLGGLLVKEGELINSPYFLGTMLFVGNYIEGNEQEILVVDGQQRLTTITILFSVISRKFKEIGENDLSNAVFKYIMTTDDNNEEIRVLKSETHYPFFAYYIQDEEKTYAQDPATDEEENIKNTYDFLYESLNEKNIKANLMKKMDKTDVEGFDYVDILKKLRDQILNSVFISISTNSKTQANMVFEILNAKGKRLASIDLIKNKIFEVLDKTEPADTAEIYWNQIKNNLKSGSESVGFSTFYRHYWISKYQKVTDNNLYDSFRIKIKPSNKDSYESFLKELEKNSKLYMQIINPTLSDYSNRKEYRWLVQSLKALNKTFNVIQVRIALLALLDAKEREILDHATLKDAILYLENFHYAFTAISSGRASRVEAPYSKFAIKLRNCKTKVECKNVIQKDLKDKLSPLMPKNDEFISGFIHLDFSKKNSANNMVTKYTLNKLSNYYSKSEIDKSEGSIEHILNETDYQSQNIGNLIVLEESINNIALNKNFKEKEILFKDSKYPEVDIFLNEYPDFSDKDILTRAVKLSQIYYVEILNQKINQ